MGASASVSTLCAAREWATAWLRELAVDALRWLVLVCAVLRTDSWRAHFLVSVWGLRSLVCSISTHIAWAALWRTIKRAGLINLLNRGYEYLRAWQYVLLAQRLVHVSQFIKPVVSDWLSICASRPICVVE